MADILLVKSESCRNAENSEQARQCKTWVHLEGRQKGSKVQRATKASALSTPLRSSTTARKKQQEH